MKHDAAITELLAKPSLEGLAYLLRHPDLWPAGFEWNFDRYDNCAIGLTTRVWGVPRLLDMMRAFGLSLLPFTRIFAEGAYSVVRKVTAEDVARRIDRHLEEVRS